MTNVNIHIEPTGGDLITSIQRIVLCKVGEYNVTVKVNENNEFLGVQNVSIDKIFYTHNSVKGNFDVSKFYEEPVE